MDAEISNHLSSAVSALNEKLAEMLGAVGMVQERQANTEEFYVELVKFLDNTARNQSTMIEGLRDEFRQELSVLRDRLSPAPHAVAGSAAVALRAKAPATRARIRCLFLVHAIETWDALADIYEAMLADERFTPIVATINRCYPGEAGFNGEDKTSAFLKSAKVEHLRLGMKNSYEALDIIKALAPEVIFRQSQWDRDIPPAFGPKELSFARLCFVPYAATIIQRYGLGEQTGDSPTEMAYNQPCHRVAWRIFCDTQFNLDHYKRYHPEAGKVVLSGNPKNQQLVKAIGSDHWPVPGNGRRAPRVVWAPHHSLGNGWLGFGVFHLIFRQMLAWAKERPDIDFVFKPHPALYGIAVNEGFVPQAELQGFLREWSGLPNCAICDGQYAELFAASDILISDGISFLLEYHLFNKPLIFFDSQRHVPFNPLGELAKAAAHVVTEFPQLKSAVLGYISGDPWVNTSERSQLRTIMLPSSRPPVDIIINDIWDGVAASREEAAA